MRPLSVYIKLPRTLLSQRLRTRQVSTLAERLQLDNESSSTLTHIHLTSSEPTCYPSYATAATLQSDLRQLFLSQKSAASSSTETAPPPPPLVLSFTPTPTYTLGRRQGSLSDENATRLSRPLSVARDDEPASHNTYTPAIVETDRGGLTTYHGPGQIVLWPILDIHSPHHKQFTVRSYARLLEEVTQATLARFRIHTYLSEADPGVWVGRAQQAAAAPDTQERKIAALGVHLRRHITGLGVALNIDINVRGDEGVNPWARFVPCGLEGKQVTCMREEVGADNWAKLTGTYRDAAALRLEIARLWALELGLRLGTARRAYLSVESSDSTADNGDHA